MFYIKKIMNFIYMKGFLFWDFLMKFNENFKNKNKCFYFYFLMISKIKIN